MRIAGVYLSVHELKWALEGHEGASVSDSVDRANGRRMHCRAPVSNTTTRAEQEQLHSGIAQVI